MGVGEEIKNKNVHLGGFSVLERSNSKENIGGFK